MLEPGTATEPGPASAPDAGGRRLARAGVGRRAARDTDLVGVVVPVHDEEALLGGCLDALAGAAAGIDTEVRIVVVLDGCRDRSADIAEGFRRRTQVPAETPLVTSGAGRRRRPHLSVEVVETGPGNVGKARALGFAHLLGAPDVEDLDAVWLATTDADTVVPPHWLAWQLARRQGGVDAWAGTVVVGDWSERAAWVASAFATGYASADERHVHGANLGFSAAAYRRAGGFPPMETGEDHGLWRALGAAGLVGIHDVSCPVRTSGRAVARAPLGFAHFLDGVERAGTTA
jgi:glycosyltransferase involved in cell wall biosynthesis